MAGRDAETGAVSGASAHRAAAALVALFAAFAASPRPASAQEDWPPRLRLGDGFSVRPQGLLHLDLGTTFDQNRPGGPGGGLNARRARIGVEGEFLGDFEFKVVWDFGGVPGSRNRLYQASLAYTGLGPATVIGGVFEPTFSLQQASATQNLLFLERATVVRVASDVAAGTARVGAEARANGERWFASAALTGGNVGPDSDSSERGAVARVAGSLARSESVAAHVGLSGVWSFQPPRGRDGRAVTLAKDAELALDRDFPLGTGSIRSDSARAGGVEFGASWKRLQVQGEWYRIEVDRSGSGRGGTLGFSGWYAQAGYVLRGEPRNYRSRDATWGQPDPADGGFDVRGGGWGTVEAGLRFSDIDLNDAEVRGGRQRVWTAGLAWWPVKRIAVYGQYQRVDITGLESGRRNFQALALRTMLNF